MAKNMPQGLSCFSCILVSGMAALILRLRSRVIDCYIPLERIKADCAEVFGGRCDVGRLFTDAEAEMSADKKRRAAEEVCEKIWALAGEHEDFDISEMRQMFDWTGDELTRPELLDELTKFYQAVYQAAENIRRWFFAADRNGRLRAITAHGRDIVLLPQERWDEIFRSLMDNGKMKRYITLLGVEPIGDGTVEKLRLLLYNDGLYEEIRRRA